jgi:hypothetical protein
MEKRLIYIILMQFSFAVEPKHVVGIDHEISKDLRNRCRTNCTDAGKPLLFDEGQAVDVPLKGTTDFPGGRGPSDVSAGNYPRTSSDPSRTDLYARFVPKKGV